jgi:3-oxoacyl-[acyl-carrier protein] reductase
MKKKCLVTGGLRGIGRTITQALLHRGDTVVVFDCAPTTDEAVIALQATGVHYLQVDVACAESVKAGFKNLSTLLAQRCDGSPLDVLVNNAGIARDAMAVRMSQHQWDSVLDVNLKGSFLCAQQALLSMLRKPKVSEAGTGQASYIINITSVVGIRGNPGQANYAASKAGLIGLTKTLAHEYASRNVLVNAIAPGFITTPMTDTLPPAIKDKALAHIPLNRFGLPEDVSNLVTFLTSGNADYITGQVIEVTGGM